MSLFAAKMKFKSKMKALEWSHHFSNCKYMGIHIIIHRIFRRLWADYSGVSDRIWPKFELIQAFMHVFVTFKNEVDSIKNEGTRVVTI